VLRSLPRSKLGTSPDWGARAPRPHFLAPSENLVAPMTEKRSVESRKLATAERFRSRQVAAATAPQNDSARSCNHGTAVVAGIADPGEGRTWPNAMWLFVVSAVSADRERMSKGLTTGRASCVCYNPSPAGIIDPSHNVWLYFAADFGLEPSRERLHPPPLFCALSFSS
jgi:hypothetical protein